MRSILKNFIVFFAAFLIIAGFLSAFSSPFNSVEDASFGSVVESIKKGDVQSVVVEGDVLSVTYADATEKKSHKESGESLASLLGIYGVGVDDIAKVSIESKEPGGVILWIATLAPFLIPLLLIGFFIWFMMRQVQGANNRAMTFGQSTAREHRGDTPKHGKKTTFADVAGSTEAKQELEEVVEFLRQPQKFAKLGARIPRGVLLVGPPGTGKTLLAKAVSGEAGVPFFHMSGSEFVEMFVGVGASRVRDLFQKAKKSSPAIVFIDEMDAVGRKRGSGLGGSHDEREQTLNQILVEMDGFDTGTNVIVMAATNRPDVLDPALLRPGRFDRRVTIDLPDIKEREAILKLHAIGKPLVKDADLRAVAQRTPGFSGADLYNLLNEAAILTARKNRTELSQDDVLVSIEKVLLGPERRSHVLSEKEKKITAYHEAGHAVVSHVLPEADPVHKVSVISRGRAGGYTLKLPLEDKRFHSRSEFIADLSVLLAGHAIEEKIFGDVTTGASSDLRKATQLARAMVTEYGMSKKLGTRTFGDKEELIFLGKEFGEQRDYGETFAQLIDEEISRLLHEAYERAQKTITENMERIERVVDTLLKEETIERDAFDRLMA
ncbi:cell division protein FtsH [bacterium CG10_46_32]|nr:MAG: cell division protein FtsH [bacterium CG10_46_32]PIR56260.1 MAG: cell division protein FtsH [Parcubacteria group bacterium CG10_big_fil_rev_8_21_14_0_10_46_32]